MPMTITESQVWHSTANNIIPLKSKRGKNKTSQSEANNSTNGALARLVSILLEGGPGLNLIGCHCQVIGFGLIHNVFRTFRTFSKIQKTDQFTLVEPTLAVNRF